MKKKKDNYTTKEAKKLAVEFAEYQLRRYAIFRNNDSDWCERSFDEFLKEKSQ